MIPTLFVGSNFAATMSANISEYLKVSWIHLMAVKSTVACNVSKPKLRVVVHFQNDKFLNLDYKAYIQSKCKDAKFSISIYLSCRTPSSCSDLSIGEHIKY